jgi:hypothetical protein
MATPSSSKYSNKGSSSSRNTHRVMHDSLVKMYLGDAASLPPISRVPNWPLGYSRFMLLAPTKFWAMPMMVAARDCSPWWYMVCSDT